MNERISSMLPRKAPRQARAKATVGAIVEAASQIIAVYGEDAVTTGSVAGRAGVSIGTLYQYFANGEAILVAIARRRQQEIARLVRQLTFDLKADRKAALRGLVRSMLDIVATNMGTRLQYALLEAMSHADRSRAAVEDIVGLVSHKWAEGGLSGDEHLIRIRAFVLSRAIGGVLRAATLEEPELLRSAEFEAAIADLVRGIVKGTRR